MSFVERLAADLSRGFVSDLKVTQSRIFWRKAWTSKPAALNQNKSLSYRRCDPGR